MQRLLNNKGKEELVNYLEDLIETIKNKPVRNLYIHNKEIDDLDHFNVEKIDNNFSILKTKYVKIELDYFY